MIDLVLFILSLICFVLAALQVSSPRVNLVALGLALFIITFIV
jgi:hypothetical protein